VTAFAGPAPVMGSKNIIYDLKSTGYIFIALHQELPLNSRPGPVKESPDNAFPRLRLTGRPPRISQFF
jgi:hypothetical protein